MRMYANLICILIVNFSIIDNAYAEEIAMKFNRALPKAAIRAVVSVASPYGEIPVNEPIKNVSAENLDGSAIFGNNKDGDIIVGVIFSSKRPIIEFSSDSTALVLVRLMVGANGDPENLDSQIRATKSFSKLVQSVNAALADGAPPLTRQEVGQNIGLVSEEIL